LRETDPATYRARALPAARAAQRGWPRRSRCGAIEIFGEFAIVCVGITKGLMEDLKQLAALTPEISAAPVA